MNENTRTIVVAGPGTAPVEDCEYGCPGCGSPYARLDINPNSSEMFYKAWNEMQSCPGICSSTPTFEVDRCTCVECDAIIPSTRLFERLNFIYEDGGVITLCSTAGAHPIATQTTPVTSLPTSADTFHCPSCRGRVVNLHLGTDSGYDEPD